MLAIIIVIVLLLIFFGGIAVIYAYTDESAQTPAVNSTSTPTVKSTGAPAVTPTETPAVKPTEVKTSAVPAVKDVVADPAPKPSSPVTQTSTTAATPAKDTSAPATPALAVTPVVKVEPPPAAILAPAKVGEKCNPGCSTGAWCNNSDNMCYETCVAKDSCTNGNTIPRKNTYYCDYSVCATKPVGALSAGCKKCPQAEGYYWCPAGVVGGPTLISSYRLPQYDPIEPQYTIGGDKYYFRESGNDCK